MTYAYLINKISLNKIFLSILTVIFLSGCAYHPVVSLKNGKKDIEKYSFVNVKFTKQLNSYDCGIACLISVINYWGEDYDFKNVISQYPPENFASGYSVYELKSISTNYKLKSFAIKGGVELIKEQIDMGRPLILAVKVRYRNFYLESTPFIGNLLSRVYDVVLKKHGHYVVAVGYNAQHLIIMDPAEGFLTYNFEEINEMREHQGNVMILVGK